MICGRCGTEIEDGAVFCSGCGANMTESFENNATQPYGYEQTAYDTGATQAYVGAEYTQYQYGGENQQGDYSGETVVLPTAYARQQAENAYYAAQADYSAYQQSSLQPSAPKQTEPKKKKSAAVLIVIAIILLVAGLAGVAFVFRDNIMALFEDETTQKSSSNEDGESEYELTTAEGTTFDFGIVPESETLSDLPVVQPEEQTVVITNPPVNVVTQTPTRPAPQPTKPPVTERVTERVTQSATKVPSSTNSGGLNSTDPVEIAAFYEAAASKTGSIAGTQTMSLNGSISGDGAIGTILQVLQPAVEQALDKNSVQTNYIPGSGSAPMLASDIKSATAISSGGKTTVTIYLKDQVDGSDCDGNTAGPVARGIGTLGSIDNALEELGAELTEGRETVTLTYNGAYIRCVIDNSTGEITSGTWFWTLDLFIGNATARLGVLANLKNLSASINYKVEI